MVRYVNVELDSVRLAQYAEQVPCYICDGGNTFDAELCRHCYAPMALAHQARSHKVRPQLMAVIGSSGVGKTVYLGMLLDMMSRQANGWQMLARGAFSITLQQSTIAALAGCRFPDKTPNDPDRWNWVHCQVRPPRKRQAREIIVPDVAGEAILEEIDHPHTYPGIRALLSRCSAAMVMVDAPRLGTDGGEQDFFAMKVLTYLSELIEDPRHGWHNRPVALVFSKADQCETAFDSPATYAAERATGLWRHCRERFKQHQFFACSVTGACVSRLTPDGRRVKAPLRIEPRGIVEPFVWLSSRMS